MLSRTFHKETQAQLFDDFHKLDTVQWTDTNDGATGTAAILVAGAAAGGWLSTPATAPAAAADDYHVHNTGAIFQFLANRPVSAEIRLRVTEAAANSSSWFFGLTSTVVGGFMAAGTGLPPANYSGAVICKPTGATAIRVETANGAVKTTNAAAATFVSGTILTVGFTFDPGNGTTGYVQFHINGTGTDGRFVVIKRHPILLAGLANMSLAFGIKAVGAAAETMLVDYVGAEIIR